MVKKKVYDQRTGEYIPTFEELGYTEQEVAREMNEEQTALFEKEYERRMALFQRKYETRRKMVRDLKERVKKEQALKHWYATLNEEHIMRLIEESLNNSDEILDYFLDNAKLESMQFYYSSLKKRVKVMRPNILPADLKKIKDFPKYDVGRDKLYGSRYSFMKIWSHVFRVINRKERSKVY